MFMSDNNDTPKIIVDDDWKKQAQAEKEQISHEAEEKVAEEQLPPMPPATLETLISGIAMQAMMVLGAIPDPRSGHRYVDLEVAKHHIDTLMMLKEKTAGNASEGEAKLLEDATAQLQMQFTHLQKMGVTRGVIAPQGEEGADGAAPAGDGGGIVSE
jgi:hypothetical protein